MNLLTAWYKNADGSIRDIDEMCQGPGWATMSKEAQDEYRNFLIEKHEKYRKQRAFIARMIAAKEKASSKKSA